MPKEGIGQLKDVLNQTQKTTKVVVDTVFVQGSEMPTYYGGEGSNCEAAVGHSVVGPLALAVLKQLHDEDYYGVVLEDDEQERDDKGEEGEEGEEETTEEASEENENLRKVVRDLTKTLYPNLVEANQAIWAQINQSVSVMQDLGKGNKGQTVHIIDFENPENNEFLCTNQFKVSGVNQNIIPDILCFVNGLPLAVIECCQIVHGWTQSHIFTYIYRLPSISRHYP